MWHYHLCPCSLYILPMWKLRELWRCKFMSHLHSTTSCSSVVLYIQALVLFILRGDLNLVHFLDTLNGNKAITTIFTWQLFLSKHWTIILLRVKCISASPGSPPCSESFLLRNEGFTLLNKYLLICRHLSLQVSQLCHTLSFLIFEIYKPLHIWLQCLTWSCADRKAFKYLLIYCSTVLGIKKNFPSSNKI